MGHSSTSSLTIVIRVTGLLRRLAILSVRICNPNMLSIRICNPLFFFFRNVIARWLLSVVEINEAIQKAP